MRIRQLLFALVACSLLWPGMAAAQIAACTGAYEKAQEEKASGRFTAALKSLRACIDTECPKFIRDDCARWMEQVETALPTVVFAIRRDGVDQTDVEVTCDGALLTRSLDGKAIPLDPGLRNFTFAIQGQAPVERQLLIREGEHNRIIQVEFQSSGQQGADLQDPVEVSATESLDTRHSPGRRYLTYGLAGAGVLGTAGFALFAILGSGQQDDLEKSCSPNCQSSQVDSVKTKYLMADISLGVGLVSLAAATYLYFSDRSDNKPSSEKKQAMSINLIPRPTSQGGMLQLLTTF